MKKLSVIIFVVVGLMILVGCGESKQSEKANGASLKVVTSFYPMYDFTKKVVGDKGEVSLLITGETEPHDYEPSAKDIAKIQDADVFVYNSNEMETWVDAVLDGIDTNKTLVVEASKGIKLLEMDEEEEGHEEHRHTHEVDPHIWLDPVLAQQEVETIRDGLIAADSSNEEAYQTNSQNFIEQLVGLDKKYRNQFEKANQKDFVTQHAAFGYLAARYDLHQIAISGISPDQEPTPSELAQIEDFVKEHQVDIIFTEELSSDKIAATIAEATGASLCPLNTLEGLSNEQQQAGEDYVSVMEMNLASLSKAIK